MRSTRRRARIERPANRPADAARDIDLARIDNPRSMGATPSETPAGGPGGGSDPSKRGLWRRAKRALFGEPHSLIDPGLFHKITLGAFLAWVALGADGLSSSSYGPDEAFRALGEHTYLAVLLALATAITVFVISFTYTKIIEQFPYGGGGYAVASQFLGNGAGVVSGTALTVDYVLTIAVSIASGGEAVFSYLPLAWQSLKLPLEFTVILGLTILNIRGVKESVRSLLPFFILFLVTHLILIGGGVLSHLDRVPEVAREVQEGFTGGLGTLGMWSLFLLFMRAYSMGAGTYTGIEAVSNGITILKEPRIATGKRTMLYMAVSLAFTAGGIIVCYLLFNIQPVEGKTMNAVLVDAFTANWTLLGIPLGRAFVVLTLTSEAILLFVAAEAGFTGGPRVMSNMAVDSWLPHRFAALSDRLTMRDGVILMGGGAAAILLYTGGNVSHLVVMYSINVFVTFSLSQIAMCRHWIHERARAAVWKKNLAIHIVGLLLCLSILLITVIEKFGAGGWVTIALTGSAIVICLLVKGHYRRTYEALARLEEIFDALPMTDHDRPVPEFDPAKPTAVLLVGSYNGLGIHSLLSIQRTFPGYFHNVVFVSVGVLDSGNFKGVDGVTQLEAKVRGDLEKYVALTKRLRWPARYEMAIGTEAVEEAEKICRELSLKYHRSVIFAGKLIFRRERWYQRLLHNETAFAVQRRLQLEGIPMTVLPVRLT